ncbi:hypothetical protein ASPVEDRAFT_82339 [Aspergillus versicolor CBS 583.65]|uniref:Uncharacterized protein n=1 Tax=Aspergillus versicolor CBS 583.65 TaxID=1036611 RepID=A0A1L9PH38_ASPVE|nr:uncharacterized protein ASPVEDRAFT_82339 [Aspergillus versicolor CBS 583.65]OJJ00783.1 hypothetical protein ASPVEDRAFT_82339 [Aspergillus versicolor CBS 583.65]
MNSAPGNPWTNTETPDDAPFSERGFGNLGNAKPAAPNSTASMKGSDNEDSVDKGGRGFLFTEKNDDKPPENPVAGATEDSKGSTGKDLKSPASVEKDIEVPPAGNTESAKGPNGKKNSKKGKGNNGKGRKSPVSTDKDNDDSQEQPTPDATDERMPKIAAIPSKDSPSGIPPGPPSFAGGKLPSSNLGSVASRVKALDDTVPAHPSRPSINSTKDSAPSPLPAPLSPGSRKSPESTLKDSLPSSTNWMVPSAPSSVTSVGIPDLSQSPQEPLSRKPSPLPFGRGSIKPDTDLNQSPNSVESSVSSDRDSAIEGRAPSPEETLSRKTSDMCLRGGYIQSGSDSGVPSQPRRSMQWDSPREDDNGMEFPSASHEVDNPPLEPASYDDLYDASPRSSQSRLSPAIDTSGSRSPQDSGSNIQPTWDTSTHEGQGEFKKTNRLCDECSRILRYISSSVPSKYLHCRRNIHPVTLRCTIWGTVDYASEVASSVSWHLHRTVSQDIRVHAAVRRAASASHREGRWYDVTSPDLPGPVNRQPSHQVKSVKLHPSLLEFIFWPSSWSSSSSSTKPLGKECDRRPRDFTILIDFPMPVDASVESKQYAGIRQRTLDHTIGMKPNIYPVAFRAQLSKYEVPFDYVLSITERTQETLYQIFGRDIPVIGCSSLPDGYYDSRVWVSILIEFPEDDKDIIAKMFGGDTGLAEGWECLMPKGCPSAFYLEWHKDPVTLGIKV